LPESKSMAKITILVFPDKEEVYIELNGFVEFLRDNQNLRSEDAHYNAALKAVANYLEEKSQEFLADHILEQEVQDLKDKGRLN